MMAPAIRFEAATHLLPPPTAGAPPLQAPVVIIAGYCDRPAPPQHEAALVEAFRGFRGTIISGGTAAGIVETVGLLQATYPDTLATVGYVPRQLPRSVRLEPRYGEHRRTTGVKFSPLEPLQYWADLLSSGIAPHEVCLLAIGGGTITAFECQMALSFGSRVALVELPGAQAATFLRELGFLGHSHYQQIEMTAAALRAFLQGIIGVGDYGLVKE
jgi:hypothetical protein